MAQTHSPGTKRQQADDPPLQGDDDDDDNTPASAPRDTTRLRSVLRPRFAYAASFYDELPPGPPTRGALRELNRRNKQQYPVSRPPLPLAEQTENIDRIIRQKDPRRAQFSRTGGPDLCDLRGYRCSTQRPDCTMRAGTLPAGLSVRVSSAELTTTATISRQSSAYDANFEQRLIYHGIYPPFYRFPDNSRALKPANLEEIQQQLKTARASLLSSFLPEPAFQDFQLRNNTRSERTIVTKVVPILAGEEDDFEGGLPFRSIAPIAGSKAVIPVPDFFDGAHPQAIDLQVIDDLDELIVPTTSSTAPVAPNFYLEAKSSGGSGAVARAQVVLAGALGCRAMLALQNYLEGETIFDGRAYAFSSTLVDGTLKLYAHHATCPPPGARQPLDYWTTQLGAYALTGDREVCLAGIAAFRALRALARQCRDQLIGRANEKARALAPRRGPAEVVEKKGLPAGMGMVVAPGGDDGSRL